MTLLYQNIEELNETSRAQKLKRKQKDENHTIYNCKHKNIVYCLKEILEIEN